jgi:NADPH-dependent 2,4-dienoyl-CoA reductase/sulfur reductase-like enzyme/bacterioferritin-associated ferredoxin
MTRTCDVAIIGAGFAGLAAADVLAGRGLDVRVFDENPHVGGQLLRRPGGASHGLGGFEFDGIRRTGLRLVSRVARRGVNVEGGTQVLGLFPGQTLLVEDKDGRVSEISARCVLVAAGARETYVPFRGWTLPGVISTGSAQILIKSSGMLPAKETLIGGLGPIMFVLAREISRHGGKVLAVLDHAGLSEKIELLRTLPRNLPKLLDGAWIMALLALSGVRVRSRMRILEASGKNRLQSVVAARARVDGEIVPGTETRYPTECLAVGFGFAPNIELVMQAGCAAEHLPEQGGWVVRVNDLMETTLENVFAAGEVTGIAGARKSLIEGRIAGLAILERLGRPAAGTPRLLQGLARKRRSELRYGAVLNRMCRLPGDWVKGIPEETIICRCEDVRMADIRKAIADGFVTPGALRRACRCGLGNCQGRICSPILRDILAAETKSEPGRIHAPSVRPPIKVVRLGALAENEEIVI